jgi:hypothetical protein
LHQSRFPRSFGHFTDDDIAREAVEVDFAGEPEVGQGFVDELLRVRPNGHPGKAVTPINMNPAVEFMVRR